MSEVHADPSRCPDCGHSHGGGQACVHCGLPLLGPLAVELWNISQSLERLHRRRAALLTALRTGHAVPPSPPSTSAPTAPAAAPVAATGQHVRTSPPPAAWTATAPALATPQPLFAAPPRPTAEWSQRRVQNTLLGLGVLLLAIAALIFTVVTWGSLDVVGRAAILLLVTAAVAGAAPAFKSRGLDATAEAFAALAIALLVIDAQGARQSVRSLAGLDARVYWAVATGVIAGLCAAYATRVRLDTPQLAAAFGSQLPGLLVALRLEDPAGSAIVLLAQTAVTAYVAHRWSRREIVQLLVAAAAVTGVSGAGLAAAGAFGSDVSDVRTSVPGAIALLAAGATSVWIGWLLRERAEAPRFSAALAAVAATAAVFAICRPALDPSSLPAVGALCALGCVAAGAALGRTWGDGPTAVGSTVAAFAVLAEAENVLSALTGPLTWLNRSWTADEISVGARTLLAPDYRWPGVPAVLATLVAATATAGLLAWRFRNRLLWSAVFAPALATTLLAASLALNWSYAAAIAWELTLVVVATALALRAATGRPRLATLIAGGTAGVLVAHAVPWSLANEATTHAALATALAVGAVAAVTQPMFRMVATAICSSAVLGWVFAITRSVGASLHVCAFVLALAAAVLLLATAVNAHRPLTTAFDATVVEIIAAGAYIFIVSLTFYEPGWACGSLLAGAIAAAAIATRRDRMFAAAVAAALAGGCAWAAAVALGTSPEGAGLTLAVVACAGAGVGWLLRERRGELIELVAAAAYLIALGAAQPSEPLLAFTLAAGALTYFAVSARADRLYLAGAASVLTAACAWVGALALGASQPGAGLTLALTGCVLAAVGWLLRHRDGEPVEVVAATAYAVGLAATSADTTLFAIALGAGALTCFAVSARGDRTYLAAVGTLLAAGCAGASAIALGASTAGAGLSVALTGCAGAGAGWLLQRRDGELVELVAAAAYALGLSATLSDITLVTFALTAGGLTCFAVSVRRDRRQVAYAGWALLTLLLWLRLAESDVTAPEPYLLPPAVLTLVIGYLRRRSHPSMSSWAAYGTGLALALEPTLYMTLSDPALTRPLLLGAGAFAVVLVGARARLQAPLLLGGATLAIDALVQIAPLAGSLPRWVSIAVVGAILLLVGATYEQRLRDLRKLQDHIEALG